MANIEQEKIAARPRGRTTRTPVGVRNRLNVRNKDDNFVYRIVNDTDDRVQSLTDAGYEVVSGTKETIGDARVNNPSQEGSVKQVSVGNGVKAVLMKIRKDWYDEDQEVKQQRINEQEASIRPDKSDGQYGELRITRS